MGVAPMIVGVARCTVGVARWAVRVATVAVGVSSRLTESSRGPWTVRFTDGTPTSQ